jgi:3-keto-5-aminohexanoate cleavage enzyme
MRKVWIEAALNGGWSRALQPGIPVTVEEIVAEGIACARRRHHHSRPRL